MRIAALTMVYNEPVWAPIWTRHYAAQLGADHCYMLDHGSDDGSTTNLPAPLHLVRLPRSPLDEEWRLQTITAQVITLLQTYDAVIHTDADEILIADPARWTGLRAWATAGPPDVVTAIGLDVQHLPDQEPALDLTHPLGTQRRWVRFASAMCKPAWVRRPVTWSPGFHSSDAPLVLNGLYLLHLRYADLAFGLNRLARSRSQAFASPDIGLHQRVPDTEFTAMMHAIADLPRRPGPLTTDAAPLRPWLNQLFASRLTREDARYKLDLSLNGDELWDGRHLLHAMS